MEGKLLKTESSMRNDLKSRLYYSAMCNDFFFLGWKIIIVMNIQINIERRKLGLQEAVPDGTYSAKEGNVVIVFILIFYI